MIDSHYFEPTTVEETCTLLAEHSDAAKVVAGGQSLAPLLRRGQVQPSCLVSIQHVAGLDRITVSEEGVKIGAMVTLDRLETACNAHPTVRALSETIKNVGDVQIRDRATLVGGICEAHPASDITAVLMALNAAVKLVTADGKRILPLRDFVADAFTTASQPDELLTEVVIPPFALPRSAAVYRRFILRAGDYPVVGVGVFVSLDDTEQCQESRIVVGACLGTPIHAREAEGQLKGRNVVEDDQPLAEAAALAAAHVTPLSDPMASGEYKKGLIGVLTREALTDAAALAVATDR
jgi:CO/xanthine dehydrogenase FAD-binding subunit